MHDSLLEPEAEVETPQDGSPTSCKYTATIYFENAGLVSIERAVVLPAT